MQRAIKELYVTRDDIQAIGKRSPLVTPLGGKVFWVSREFRVQRSGSAIEDQESVWKLGRGGGGEGRGEDEGGGVEY